VSGKNLRRRFNGLLGLIGKKKLKTGNHLKSSGRNQAIKANHFFLSISLQGVFRGGQIGNKTKFWQKENLLAKTNN